MKLYGSLRQVCAARDIHARVPLALYTECNANNIHAQFPETSDNWLGELAQWQLIFVFLGALVIRVGVNEETYPTSFDKDVSVRLT